MKITINDIRAAGHCVQGTKAWFEAHGLDPKLVLGRQAQGIDEDVFLATGDALAQQVVDHKRNRLTV